MQGGGYTLVVSFSEQDFVIELKHETVSVSRSSLRLFHNTCK